MRKNAKTDIQRHVGTNHDAEGDKIACICITNANRITEQISHKKSRIRETKHLSTDADRSTDAIGGGTKNTPKPDFFEKRKKSSKTQKLKNV